MTTQSTPRNRDANMPALVFGALLVSVGYFYTVTDRCWRGIMDCFDNVNPLTAPAPFRYRVLAPIIEGVFSPTNEPYRAYVLDAAFHAFCVALVLPMLYLWLKRFLAPSRALVGVFTLCLAFMLSFQFYMPFGTTIIELTLLIFALNVIDKSFGIYAILLGLSAFNRETSLLLVAVYVAWHGRAGLGKAFALLALWAVITAGLHVALGAAPHVYGLQNTLTRNLEGIAQAVLVNAPFVVLWVMTAANFRHVDRRLQRFAVIALVYAAAVAVGATWSEVRVLLPLFPLVLPIALADSKPIVT